MNLNKVQKILEDELTLLANDLKDKHIELGMKASGNWVQKVTTLAEVTGQMIVGALVVPNYTKQLTDGRKPGRMPPIDEIEQWIQDKNLLAKVDNDITLRGLAYVIARKIGEQGTKYFRQGGTDLMSSVATEERINSIIQKVYNEIVSTFVVDVRTRYQEFAEI